VETGPPWKYVVKGASLFKILKKVFVLMITVFRAVEDAALAGFVVAAS
jgi:hypothetical protein